MRFISLLLVIITFLSVCGCSEKAYPDNRFTFSDKYRNLVKPYSIGDTLSFKNNLGEIAVFVITKIDSTIENEKGWFINQRPYKYVFVSYNQLPVKQWLHEVKDEDGESTMKDDILIGLNIYPDNGKQSCFISFKRFRGKIEKENNSMFTQPIRANDLFISNYYKVENYAGDLVKSPSDVKAVYISNKKGIIAWQDYLGNWWTRVH